MAANNISQVQHVIIVIQENRTPTNLDYPSDPDNDAIESQ